MPPFRRRPRRDGLRRGVRRFPAGEPRARCGPRRRDLRRILGAASSFEPLARARRRKAGAIRRTIQAAIHDAGLEPADVGHVKADGQGTIHDDRIEAQAIRDLLGEVPVTAPKSFFGNLSAGSGAVELAVSVLAFQRGTVPPVLNYHRPDPECPINVIRDQPMAVARPVALVLSHSRIGHSMGVVVAGEQ